jgi:hypothetical protein
MSNLQIQEKSHTHVREKKEEKTSEDAPQNGAFAVQVVSLVRWH